MDLLIPGTRKESSRMAHGRQTAHTKDKLATERWSLRQQTLLCSVPQPPPTRDQPAALALSLPITGLHFSFLQTKLLRSSTPWLAPTLEQKLLQTVAMSGRPPREENATRALTHCLQTLLTFAWLSAASGRPSIISSPSPFHKWRHCRSQRGRARLRPDPFGLIHNKGMTIFLFNTVIQSSLNGAHEHGGGAPNPHWRIVVAKFMPHQAPEAQFYCHLSSKIDTNTSELQCNQSCYKH